MKVTILLLLLTIGTSAQCLTTPKGTGGYATFDVSPIMSQIYGRAGNTGTGNDVNFILQGYSGVAWLSAPVIDLNYVQFNLNGKTVTFGPPDSGGVGHRMVIVEN